MKDDLYKTLNASRNASTSEIKSRYKSLAKRYHPDRSGDTDKMSRINNAYAVLKDPLLRFQYNKTTEASGVLGTDQTQNTANGNPAHTASMPPQTSPPKLKFQPFRSVSFVAILILTFAILGVFGYAHEAAAPGDVHLGSTPSSTPAAGSTNTQAPQHGIGQVVHDSTSLLSRAEKDIDNGQADITACNNQRVKDYQALQTTQQQIRLTQSQLAQSLSYTRHGEFIHVSSVQMQYDQLHNRLTQQVEQYHQDLSALGATGKQC